MVQAATKRLVTEQALIDKLAIDIPLKLSKSKLRLLGDQFDGVRSGASVPASLAQISHTNNVTLDGGNGIDGAVLAPQQMYNIAECNWSDQTLSAYGAAWLNYSKANSVATDFEFTTMFEGTTMIISAYKLGGILQDFRVWINDMPVLDWYEGTRAAGVLNTNKNVIPAVGDNINHFININFARHGIYKIRVAGIVITGTSSLLSCYSDGKFFKPAKQRVVGIISDSWYETVSDTCTSLNSAVELVARMGWKQWNMAVGGSGFVNPSGSGAGNPMHYGSDNVFTSLLKAPPLDLLLLNGSGNDMGYPEADVIAAMQAFFTRWRTVRPDTPIVWQGIEPVAYFENIYTSAALIARETALAAVALADPNVIGVIESAKENWITGTGYQGAQNGTGNQDYVTGPDQVHNTTFGCELNSALVHERLKSMRTWKGVAA